MSVRIASLIPSGTDIAVALGLADNLVGVSHECDNPRIRDRGLPVLTAPAVPTAPGEAPAAEVDAAVSAAKAAGTPLYQTDVDLLRTLAPDVVLTQDICDVCAVPGRDVSDKLPPGARMVTLQARSAAGLEDDLLNVAEAVGADSTDGTDSTDMTEAAMGLISRLRAVRFEVMGRIGGARRLKVLTLEWGDPPFIGGHWVPEMVGTAGGDNLFVEPGDPSIRTTWDAVGAQRPEVVVFMPCGYTLGQAVDEGRSLLGRLPATPFWAVDATALFSRCTPASISNGIHVLAGILHPKLCPEPSPYLAQQLA